jgi:hypothetical protein
MSTEVKAKKERVNPSAQERAAAVLSIWTERRRPSEVSKELGVSSMMISVWQQRALEGMLRALEPRSRPESQWGPRLSPTLEKLLQRETARASGKLVRLEKRLLAVQEPKAASAPSKEK